MMLHPRLHFAIAFGCLFVGGLVLPEAAAQDSARSDLLIGADVVASASAEVMSVFHEIGFDYARITGGGYGWAVDAHTRQVENFERRGVKVLLQLGSHYPSADYFQFRDSWFVDHKGETGEENRSAWAISYSGKHWPQYSYASRDIRRKMERDFAEYLSHFDDFDNVAAICLHNEPGLHWLTDRIFDYSPPALAAFTRWLQDRYGTIEKLNEAWGTEYAVFADAAPPREEPAVSNLAAWLDWRRANAAFIRDFLQWEIALARRLRPGAPVTTNLAGPLDWWYAWRISDNFQFSEGMDIVGIDIYPGSWTRRWHAPYTMDMSRGIAQGRPVHVLECETYGGGQDLRPEERARRLAADIWTYLGHGARGILLWGLTGRGGFTLTEGEFNPRCRTMQHTVRLARTLGLEDYRPVSARVAVVVDPDVYIYHAGHDETPPYFLDKAGQGMYAAARDAGYLADVIFAEQVRRDEAADYAALLLPNQTLMDGVLAEQLDEFVRRGGLLIVDATFAEVDEHGRPFAEMPGHGLADVLGLHVTNERKDAAPIHTAQGDVTAVMVGRALDLDDAQAIGTFGDGSPAVTVNEYGDGAAVYLAGTASVAYADGWRSWAQPGLSRLVGSLIAEHAGLAPIAALEYDGQEALDVSVLENGQGGFVITLTLLSEQGKLPEPARDVRLHLGGYVGRRPAPFRAFAPAEAEDKPVPLDVRAGLQGTVLQIPVVDSAVVIVAESEDASTAD